MNRFSMAIENVRLTLRSRRRGSFMVLVVGTLAMMSIIMIVYVAVGNADKRASASLARRDRSDEIISLFSDYVAQVVADDTVAVSPDPSNSKALTPALSNYVREAWDIPATNWQADSSIADRTNPSFFRATGAGDDPWLASTTPTWINFDPANPANNPPPIDGTAKHFNKRRDWLHITNIAPDGRFVNLYNLRDNFNARPGTSETASDRHTNGNLSLTDQTGKKDAPPPWSATPINSFAPEYQNPAIFDSWQVGAFRPARGPYTSAGAPILPSDPAYPPYQWADTDGDGFLDARWFEMIDSRDPNQTGGPATPQFFRSLMPSDPNFRWFFAARIIDLSSLVNINIAGDSNANPNDASSDAGKMPNKADVIGLNPSDIDLRRLLTMRDFRETILNGSNAAALANQINDGTQTLSYDGGYTGLRGPAGGKPASQDYAGYTDKDGGTFPGNPSLSLDIGWGGYESLRAALNVGRPPGRFSNFTVNPLLDAKNSFKTIAARNDFFKLAAPSVSRPAYRAADTTKGDPTATVVGPGGGFPSAITGAIDYGLGFKLNNLIELLTYRSVNDSEVTSSLEAALGGQRWSKFATPPTAADINAAGFDFSPMRDNRSTALERERLVYLSGASAGQPTDSAMLKSYIDLRQYLTTISGARPIVPASVSVTNIDNPPALSASDLSTYVPLDPTAKDLFEAYTKALMPGLAYYNPDSTQGAVVEVWKDITADAESKSLRGMFYGGQGPMTALLAAGHMAANFATGAQPISGANVSHTPYVLVLAEWAHDKTDNRLPRDIANTATMSWKRYFPTWWSEPQHQLNLARPPAEPPATTRSGKAKLSIDVGTQPVPAPAVNIYGVGDAHPFLVEAATYTVYRDTPPLVPDANGQVTKANPESGNTPYPDQADPSYTYITVNGNVDDATNPDFVCRMFAVKVHNPYAQPIRLTDSGFKASGLDVTRSDQFQANRSGDYFYVKYGTGTDSKCFVLADVKEDITAGVFGQTYSIDPVTVMPGETIVFYALSESSSKIAWERIGYWNRTQRSAGNDKLAVNLTGWLDTQLPPTGTPMANGVRRVQMLRTDDGFDDSRPSASSKISFASFARDRLTPKTGSDQTIMLMRALQMDTGLLVNDAGGVGNSVKNDRLCDRLRIKTDFDLDRRLNGTQGAAINDPLNTRVTGRKAAVDIRKEDQPTVINGNYNTRFMVTIGASVQRPGDPATTGMKAGMIPAWAIDPKDGGAGWYVYKEIPTRGTSSLTSPFQLTENDLNAGTSGAVFWGDRPQEWSGNQTALFPSMKQNAADYSPGSTIGNPTGATFADLRRELATNQNKYQRYKSDGSGGYVADGTSSLRQTDLLNVMAIGSIQAPIDASGNEIKDTNNNPDWTRQWTTTAEALAMAMGYGTPPANSTAWTNAGSVYGPLDFYYRDFYSVFASATPKRLFDSGYLRTDDFVSVRYDTSGKAYTAGTGAPIAGNVLTMFRTQPDDYASLSIATPGLVNINTAPQAVLRVLPMTFPSINELVSGSTQKATFWPGGTESERETSASQTDIAAMIESYRDKIAVELRPTAKNPNTTMPTWFAGFFDRSKNPMKAVGDQDKGPNDPQLGDYANLPGTYVGGRYWSTGLRGIRENAGFQTPAELLALRHVEFTPAAAGETVTTSASDLATRASNIDFLGYRAVDKPSNLLGSENIVEQVVDLADPANPKVTDIKPLQFGHTYQDKLKILSGLLGSISVRSDMYAVWFIARGYQRSDVEGLPAAQPMVPSVERRFLMIIDRSNVTKIGQKPRVLAFVELPL